MKSPKNESLVMPNIESVQDADIAAQIHPYTNLSLHEEAGPMVVTKGDGAVETPA